MPSQAADAGGALPARGVNLTDHTLACQRRVSRLDHLADELMTRHAAIVHVPAREFKVGPAYPRHPNAHKALARRRSRFRIVTVQSEAVVIDCQRAHRVLIDARIETKNPRGMKPAGCRSGEGARSVLGLRRRLRCWLIARGLVWRRRFRIRFR